MYLGEMTAPGLEIRCSSTSDMRKLTHETSPVIPDLLYDIRMVGIFRLESRRWKREQLFGASW